MSIYSLLGPVPDRVRAVLGDSWWPQGLRWNLLQEPRRNTVTGKLEARASYTIPSKGRTGAAGRQKLMAHGKRFSVRLDRNGA